jgi:hypothetical protein
MLTFWDDEPSQKTCTSSVKLKTEEQDNTILLSVFNLQSMTYYLPKTLAQSSPNVPRFSHTVMPQAFMAAIFP